MAENSDPQLKILVSRNWEESGPYTLEQLRAKIMNGEISLDSWFWQTGMPKWESLSALFPDIEKERKKTSRPIITIEIGGSPIHPCISPGDRPGEMSFKEKNLFYKSSI